MGRYLLGHATIGQARNATGAVQREYFGDGELTPQVMGHRTRNAETVSHFRHVRGLLLES